MVAPKEAVSNLVQMEKYGALGEFGFYEALDFTSGAPPQRNGIMPSSGVTWRTTRVCPSWRWGTSSTGT